MTIFRSASSLVSALAFGAFSVLGAQATAKITVGRNVHVSKSLSGVAQREVLIAADPENADRLIGCSISKPDHGLYGERTAVFTSNDRGKSWSLALVDSLGADMANAQGGSSVDPGCVFGVNGALHFVRQQPLGAFWSADGGKTWGEAKVPMTKNEDRANIVVDHTGGKYHGRVYAFAQTAGEALDQGYIDMGITLWRSLDGGKTFERPIERFPAEKSGMQPGPTVVMPDGTWAVVIRQLAGQGGIDVRNPDLMYYIKVATSSDGGETLNEAATVAGPFKPAATPPGVPSIAVDSQSASFRGRLYVAWEEWEFGGRNHVALAYSSDRGKTWSKPRIVNDDLKFRENGDLQRNVGLCAVAVNRQGVVGVVWEDRRNNTANDRGHEIRFAASLDGGDTFSPSIVVSEKPLAVAAGERWIALADGQWGASTTFEINNGALWGSSHTMGIAADIAGDFHPLWIDNRTGLAQVWTAPVTVDGPPAKFGDASLASLGDISNTTKIEIVGSSYDDATHRVTARVRIRNLSPRDTLVGPVKVRALLIASEATTAGTALAVGAKNGMRGPGAMWDFTSLIPASGLAPNAVTPTESLVFELAELRPVGAGKTFRGGSPLPYSLLRFDGQVVGAYRSASRR